MAAGAAAGAGIFGPAMFVLFVFQCIALTHSDTDAYYAACGHTLRDSMMASLILSTTGPIFVGISSLILSCCSVRAAGVLAIVFVVFYAIAEVVLSILILNESVIALNNSNCTAAMQSTDGGISSVSAYTGSPLLGIIGIVSSSLTFFSLFVFLCLCALSTGFVAALYANLPYA
jgi:hypothetical protein